MLGLLCMMLPTASAKESLPQKGMVFHYAPYPRGVDFENPGELLDDVRLLQMLEYDAERDSTWKAARQHKSEAGFMLEKLYMVDADVSFAKTGGKQTLYVDFELSRGDDYEGPVAFVRRGEEPSKWYYPFRFNKRREIKLDGRAQPGDSAMCHAQWRTHDLYQGMVKVLVEMDKQDGKTTVYLSDTAIVFYNTARTDAERESDRLVICPFSKGRMNELVFWKRHLTEKEKQSLMSRSTWKKEYVLPTPQTIKNEVTDQTAASSRWKGYSWVSGGICLLLIILSIALRAWVNLPVPYVFNGSKTVLALAVVGAVAYGYNMVSQKDLEGWGIVLMCLYLAITIIAYVFVSYAPDLYGDLNEKGVGLGFINRLPGVLKFLVYAVVLYLAYIVGQLVIVLMAFFVLWMFIKNTKITWDVWRDLKSNPDLIHQ